MNKLLQLENNLIGDSDSYKALNQKEKVRILLISDSHGARDLFKKIIEEKGKECDMLAFCGDGSYDLSTILEEAAENSELMKVLPPVIAMVQGNGDPAECIVSFCPGNEKKSQQEDLYRIDVPGLVSFSAAGRKIIMTHGNRQGVYFGTQGLEAEAQIEEASAVFFGHSHIPVEINQMVYIANPGSISHPRGHSPQSFGIVEVTKNTILTIFHRIEENPSGIQFTPYYPGVYSLF